MSVSEKYASTALALVATAVVVAVVRKKWGSRHSPYPSGPKGYPMIGNILDFPKHPIWEGFTRMARECNTDVLHMDMMGSHLVILSDDDVAKDLLERRSLVYIDRPRFPMVNELMGCSWSFALMPYGDTWRIHRRLFHRFFNISVADRFDESICKAVNTFLHRLFESPERFLKHVHFLTGSLALSITYGVNIVSESDRFYAASEEAMHAADAALLPGAFLVDAFPSLKYVPEWFPGAGFKKFAKTAKKHINKLADLPFQHVKESIQANTITTPSLVATCFEELPELAERGVDEEVIRGVAATVFLGGEDSTASIIQTFFLAVTMHPEVVRLAQQELDEVLGGERLPNFSDKSQLPYISAIMKESLRWRPPNPLGTPHRSTEDDVYDGRFIPAGSTVFLNLWAIFHNESVYPNPDTFNPYRFLKDGQIDPDVKDPERLIFGFGRRICPGRHFALQVLFLTIARTLATFDISMCLDEAGNPIVPDGKFTHGIVCHPLPFRSNIKPRSTQTLSLITGH